MTSVRTVGFIGLGAMGGAIATRIIEASWPTVLWARRPEALKPFGRKNVTTVPTPRALATRVDLVGVCVWSDDDVRQVLLGESGILDGCRPGTIIAIHSTIQPSTCRELAAAAAERDAILLDAPVSGGRKIALDGSLTIAIGGNKQAATDCQGVFRTFANSVVHLGDVGSGQFAKLLNNALLAANLAIADDALALGETLGLDADRLVEFLSCASGRSYALGVAQAARASAETRKAAATPLRKDVDGLQRSLDPGIVHGTLLREAASQAILRLEQPSHAST